VSAEDRYEKAPTDRGQRRWWCRECPHGEGYALILDRTLHNAWHASQPVEKPVDSDA